MSIRIPENYEYMKYYFTKTYFNWFGTYQSGWKYANHDRICNNLIVGHANAKKSN